MTSNTGSHGSFGGSRGRRQRTTSQQSVPGLPLPQGSSADSTSSFVVGPSSIANSNKRRVHESDPDHLEIFKIGRCEQLHDNSEHWVDDESRSRNERMTRLTTPLESESGSTPISPEEAFTSVMEKDRSGYARCGGSRETLQTQYESGEESSSSNYQQQQIQTIEDRLRAQGEELEQLRAQVEELRKRQFQVEGLCRRIEEMHRQIEEMHMLIEEMRRNQPAVDKMHRQMSPFMTQFQASKGGRGVQPQGAVVSDDDGKGYTNEEGDDYDYDDDDDDDDDGDDDDDDD